MPQPTMTVLLGATDITTRVSAPDPGTASARWRRGANFDASGAVPGECVLLVDNHDRAFNPRNSGSAFITVLKLGTLLRLYATHTSYQWTITSSSAADERITTSTAHGLAVNDRVRISGHSGSTPSLNADWTVFAVPTTTTFTVAPDRSSGQTNITVGGTGGTVVLLLPQFTGRIERIVPRDDGFAELHAKDVLWEMGQESVALQMSTSTTIRDFRDTLVRTESDIVTYTDLDGNTPELDIPLTYSFERTIIEELNDLNQATGTMHYIAPSVADGPIYTTRDRSGVAIDTAVETWSDADTANPFATSLRQFDFTDEGIINRQRAFPTITKHQDESTIWDSGDTPQHYPTGATDTFQDQIDAPADNVYADATFTGTFTFDVSSLGEWLDITYVAVAAGILEDFPIKGRLYTLKPQRTVDVSDSASIATHGEYSGPDITGNRYLHTRTAARALVDYILWRYAQPRARPAVTFTNRFGTQLLREPADIVSLTSSELSLTAARMIILAFETSVRDSGALWETTYELEELPTAETIGEYDDAASDYDAVVYG